MSPEAIEQEIAKQVASGLSIEAVLQAAQAVGITVESFSVAAAKAGVPVASITTAVLNEATDSAAALKTLGVAFAADPAALEAVFATAVTVPALTLDPTTIESSIEAGCGRDCLPQTVVAAVVASTPSQQTAAEPVSTTTTSTTTSGGGLPISPSS